MANRAEKVEEELNPEKAEEYEMVPLSPLRRLEKRLDTLEAQKTMTGLERFVDKIIDMVELNQKIVDEVVKANTGLREDMAVLIGKMDELYSRLGDFIEIIKSAGEEESTEIVSKKIFETGVSPLVAKVEDMSKSMQASNAAIADTLAAIEKRLRVLPPSILPRAAPAPIRREVAPTA